MYFKQFYLGCLAHASYLIGSEGEAVVVDPQRDVDQYVDEADAQQFKIRYVIERTCMPISSADIASSPSVPERRSFSADAPSRPFPTIPSARETKSNSGR